MKPQTEDIELIIREALTRYEKGKEEYGDLDLNTDQRNFIDEAVEEMLDTINYLVYEILRLRKFKS